MSRVYTTEEIQQQFLAKIRAYVAYWDTHSLSKQDALDGLAFSILNILDGSTDLPGFLVAPHPHPDDSAYHQIEGTNYYPENHAQGEWLKGQIAGNLHELYCQQP
jgi:hypothetical protein